MSVNDRFDSQGQGGWNTFPDRVTKKIFYKKDVIPKTKPAVITSGQVIKAYTPLAATATTGKLVVHPGFTQSARVTFSAGIDSGETVILGGLTFTAGTSGATAAQLFAAWSNNGAGIPVGTGYASLAHITDGGTFTAGTMTLFNVTALDATTLLFNSTLALTDATDLAATGTGAAAVTIVNTEGVATRTPIAGYTAYDVNASSADTKADVYISASFWADDDGTCALRWASSTGETMTNADGTTTAVTAFNTGCAGDLAANRLHKQLFVAGSNFEELGFVNAGDKS